VDLGSTAHRLVVVQRRRNRLFDDLTTEES